MTASDELKQQFDDFRRDFQALYDEIGKVIVGQGQIITSTLTALLAGGHVLLEGVPGLGKTLLVRTLANVLDARFSRIQFTPDLMPADMIGTNVMIESDDGARRFEFQRGPIFANVLLADEINRATPKTQSALLEAMQEKSVTVAGATHYLDELFFVLATQNPLEMEGTYPLPEAQLDRFFFKLIVAPSTRDELCEILDRTTSTGNASIKPVLDTAAIIEHQQSVRAVTLPPGVRSAMATLVVATHPGRDHSPPKVDRYVRLGASPRAGQALSLASKVQALRAGRTEVTLDDLHAIVIPAMRHRLVLNFDAQADGVTSDDLLQDVLDTVPLTMTH